MPGPPLLIDFHPIFGKLVQLGADEKTVADIEAGGSPAERLAKIRGDGLLDGYEEPDRAERYLLGGAWGDPEALRHVSDALGEACKRCQASGKPLRVSWAAGATTRGVRAVHEESEAEVAFVLLTPPPDFEGAFADGKAFDVEFRRALKEHGVEVEAWTREI